MLPKRQSGWAVAGSFAAPAARSPMRADHFRDCRRTHFAQGVQAGRVPGQRVNPTVEEEGRDTHPAEKARASQRLREGRRLAREEALVVPLDDPTVIADGPAPALGVVIDKHNVVLHVEPNSMAAQAQLQPGDQILSVNGLALSDKRQEVKAAIAQATSTSPLALRISRNGNELNLSAAPASSTHASIPAQPVATTTPVRPPDDYL